MKLQINDSFYVSDIAAGDEAAYIEHFKEKQIADQTLNIPFPYTAADADWWIKHNIEATKAQGGRSVNWAIRRASDGFLIGGIGFLGLKIGESYKAELAYFLAKPYWGHGLMTATVKKVVEYGFENFGLDRITAHVFHFNTGSAKVLQKAGFTYEGYLRSLYKKNGQMHDGIIFAMIRDDLKKESPPARPDFIKNYLEIQDPDTAHYPNSDEILSQGSPFSRKFGFKAVGVHHELLPPGRRTSWPHAESDEEEFVYVIDGHPDAWIDGTLYRLNPGDGVGFPPGTGICHTFINNTHRNVRLIVVGERTKKTNKCIYALHPARNEEMRKDGILWEDPPKQVLGGHDGLPDALRKK